MNAALLTPSKYIKAASLGGKDRTVTISGVKLEQLEKEDGSKETRGVIYIEETPKGWVLNVTNVKCLIALFGTETNDWVGKKVTLYPEVNDQSETGFAIRVRGSPNLTKDVTFTLKLSRKKPRKVTLKATGGNAKPADPQPNHPPASDTAPQNGAPSANGPDDGGVPFDPPSDGDEIDFQD